MQEELARLLPKKSSNAITHCQAGDLPKRFKNMRQAFQGESVVDVAEQELADLVRSEESHLLRTL